MWSGIKNLFVRSISKKIAVLVYHRVADVHIDPWQICVSPQNFEQHLSVLKSTFSVIDISEAITQVRSGHVKEDAVVITFDDAYLDNYTVAKPLLEKYELPACFFVPGHFIESGNLFWWDVLQEIFLEKTRLPAQLKLNKAGENIVNLTEITSSDALQHRNWKWPSDPPTARCEIFLQLWRELRDLKLADINFRIDELLTWSGQKVSENIGRPMSLIQLKESDQSKFITIGAHTMTHPALGVHSREFQIQEIDYSRSFLRHFKGYVDLLAYPYGSCNSETFEVVEALGMVGAFSTDASTLQRHSHPYNLGRFHIPNITGSDFLPAISRFLA